MKFIDEYFDTRFIAENETDVRILKELLATLEDSGIFLYDGNYDEDGGMTTAIRWSR